MAVISNLSSLNALFKTVYSDKVVDLVPSREEILKNVSFISSDKKNGGSFYQPVLLNREHGVTFLGENDTILNLEEPAVRQSTAATVKGSAMTMRTYLSLTAISRAAKSPRAFIDATRYAVEGLTKGFASVQEQVHWHGRRGLGFGAVTTATKILTVDAAEFAEAIWVGAIGMQVEIRNGTAGAPGATVLATTEITAVNMSTREITVASTGTAVNATSYNIVRKGSYGVESYGLMSMLANTGSLFGIDAAAYDGWRANQYAVGGALSFATVSEAIALAQGRGLDGSIRGYVHPLVFRSLLPDYIALKSGNGTQQTRTMNESESKSLAHGTKSVQFYVNSVETDIVATTYCKRGYAAFVNLDGLIRIGSTPMTFNLPGLASGENEYFRLKEDKNACEVRVYADEALFWDSPSNSIYFSGIVS